MEGEYGTCVTTLYAWGVMYDLCNDIHMLEVSLSNSCLPVGGMELSSYLMCSRAPLKGFAILVSLLFTTDDNMEVSFQKNT